VSPTCRVPEVQQTSAPRALCHLPAKFQNFNKHLHHVSSVTYLQSSVLHCAVERQRQTCPTQSVGVQNASLWTNYQMVLMGLPYPPQVVPVLCLYRGRQSLCRETNLYLVYLTQLDLKCHSLCRVKSRWKLLVTCCRWVIKFITCQGQYTESRSFVFQVKERILAEMFGNCCGMYSVEENWRLRNFMQFTFHHMAVKGRYGLRGATFAGMSNP
jgi:hypothetical protein